MKHVLMLLICSFVIQGKYRLFLSNFSIRNLVYLLVCFFFVMYKIFCLCLKHFYFKEKKMNGLIAFFLFCFVFLLFLLIGGKYKTNICRTRFLQIRLHDYKKALFLYFVHLFSTFNVIILKVFVKLIMKPTYAFSFTNVDRKNDRKVQKMYTETPFLCTLNIKLKFPDI